MPADRSLATAALARSVKTLLWVTRVPSTSARSSLIGIFILVLVIVLVIELRGKGKVGSGQTKGERTEDRGRRTEDRGRRTEDRGRRTEDGGRRSRRSTLNVQSPKGFGAVPQAGVR